MTLEELLDLPPSTALDEAVSEHVLDHRRTPKFQPSREIAFALKVVAAMHRNGYMVEIIQTHDGVWRVMFWAGRLGTYRRLHADMKGESLPETICKAALTVMLSPRGGDEDSFPPNRPDIDAARRTMRIKEVGDGD